MKFKKSPGHVALNGGLGNQFFQLAAAFGYFNGDITLNCSSKKIRRNSLGYPEICSFDFDRHFELVETRILRRLTSFYINLLFKFSAKVFQNRILNLILNLIKKLLSGRRFWLTQGVGFDAKLSTGMGEKTLVGAFHTYRYFEFPNVERSMRSARLLTERPWLSQLVGIAKTENPIVLHIRLGDYLEIPELGFLSSSYYSEAIRLATKTFPDSRIWLFSDDPDNAKNIFASILPNDIRVIDYALDDSAGNLQAMREGVAFIISNSTYSWWAAKLAYKSDPLVIAPRQWFNSKETPDFLLPKEWTLI